MTSTRQGTRKSAAETTGEQQLIVEEKIVKVNGETTIRKYAKCRFLGKGGFARCYEFQNMETKKVSAAKIVPKASLTKNRAKQKLMSEIRIHRSLHHTNIVAFEHFFEDNENVYILLELCQNQTLNELLKRRKRLTELEVQCYLVHIISALKYLHSHRVIHRDLKLGNFFLTDKMELKVGDFGLATKLEFEGDRKRTICGTPNYIAPEILDGKSGHSYEVDIWSLGVILYTLLIGKPPFETSDVKTTYRRIKNNSYSFPEHVSISEHARNLITRILVLDPLKRPNLEQIVDHPFFNQGNTIPKLLPASTLACPPSSSYIKQFVPSGCAMVVKSEKTKLESTVPVPAAVLSKARESLGNTDKIVIRTSAGERGMKAEKKEEVVAATSGSRGPKVWVRKWVDYSSKYGLGYLLSNSAPGVFFNDSSKIILDSKGHQFSYIERRPSDKQDVMTNHTLTDYPKELQKKVTLLQHFRSYLEGDSKGKPEEEAAPSPSIPIYVKKWMRTRHAIMFRLSNKIVQVIFQDHTEIILCSETRQVTYVNKKADRLTYPLATALESSNIEMSKRLKYTKDILTHMLSSSQPAGEQRPSADKPTKPGEKVQLKSDRFRANI